MTMIYIRTLVSMISLVALLVSQGISHTQPTSKQQRSTRSVIYPFYRVIPPKSVECLDDQCAVDPIGRSTDPRQAIGNVIDYNGEFEDFIKDSMRPDGPGKRNRLDAVSNGYDSLMALAASAPASWATFSNGATSLVPMSSNSRSVFENINRPSCTCETKNEPRDLGAHHYPRYFTEYKCEKSNCLSPPYSCKEIKFKVYVLKPKEDGEIKDIHAPLLPSGLREEYVFVTVLLSVGCKCHI